MGVVRKGEKQFTANALSIVAHGADPKLGDALIRFGTVTLVGDHRQAAVPLGIRNEALNTDALLIVTAGVGRLVGAVLVMLAGHRGRVLPLQQRMARAFEAVEMGQAGTVPVDIVAVRKVIVRDALLVDFTRSTQGNGFLDALGALSAGQKSLLADAGLGLLVAVRVVRVAGTLATDFVRRFVVHRLTRGFVPVGRLDTLAGALDARGVEVGSPEDRAVRILGTIQVDNLARSNGLQDEPKGHHHQNGVL